MWSRATPGCGLRLSYDQARVERAAGGVLLDRVTTLLAGLPALADTALIDLRPVPPRPELRLGSDGHIRSGHIRSGYGRGGYGRGGHGRRGAALA